MVNMKFSLALVACLAGQALASPTATKSMGKRATVSDAAHGYASQNGGTNGGAGGTTTTVSSYAQFTAAVFSDDAKIVYIDGPISQQAKQVRVGSNTSIIGKNANAVLEGFGLLVKEKKNIIIRNLGIKNLLAANGDAIGVQYSTNIWIDHCDVSSDRDHDKDYYDGLIDFSHASDFITVSNTFIHDHWKTMLFGHSDNNAEEDTGFLHVTLNNNYLRNLNSRNPSFRFGTGHLYNNYYQDVDDGINTRLGAQLLVEGNMFEGETKPLYATDGGFAVAKDNDFGVGVNSAPQGTLTSVPYQYELLAVSAVKEAVSGVAGQTLTF
ncbi:putative pectate lyase A [Aspergillus coremiiformis]|uniref:pectate lyase n=1 Tax=Aspergillus coremiiformis TaxID=138285 RepID=A0A5N6ZFF1_9EURO|nr:putative pectate lyase A [Aspergillus coremiiformis]